MENPYAQSAATPSTPEDQLRSDYETAIGPNSGYYLKYFEAFDAGESKASWHWPAFFVTSFWFLYRKMWMWGILTLLWPYILFFVLGIAAGIVVAATKSTGAMAVIGIVSLLLLAAPYFLLPIYANALYWGHIRKLIAGLPKSIATVPDKRTARLERNGGTGVGPMIAFIVGGGFFLIFIIGILAAIAIPAYQDYTIRAQITEGLNLAAAPKAAVAEYFAQHQAWPENDEAAGMTDAPSGKYVTSVTVQRGSVLITYGGAANKIIAGQRLAMHPGTSASGDVVWVCGDAPMPEGVQAGPGPSGSEVASKYLPTACRGK